MSYDAGMYMFTGKEEHEIESCGNYTYNVGAMYRLANPDGLYALDGKLGSEAGPIANSMYTWMLEHWQECEALNPENGWGNYNGAVNFLHTIMKTCYAHPLATLKIT